MHGSKYLTKKKNQRISEEIKLPERPGKLAASLVMYLQFGGNFTTADSIHVSRGE